MSYEIPTLPALVQRAAEDLSRAGVDGVLRRSDSAVIARVHSGAMFGLYGKLAWMAKQILPDTCDEDILERWALLKGVPRTLATRAVGAVDVTGATDVMVPVGFSWQTRGGTRLVASVDTVLVAGAASIPVRADLVGQAGNVSVGTNVSAISPRVGLVEQGVVAVGGIVGGTDDELLERWRRRVMRAFRVQPHGGDADDYETWALEVPGITRAWCRSRWVGPGTVGIFVVRDDDVNIIPDAAELAAVKVHIESKQPVTSDVYVMAPTLLSVPVEIRLDLDTDKLRVLVGNALQDLFFAEADLGGRMYRTHLSAAISNAPGEMDHTLVMPAADIVPAAGELPVLGGIAWR